MQNQQLLTNETAEEIKKINGRLYIGGKRELQGEVAQERHDEIGEALSYSYPRETPFYKEVKGEK